MLVRGMTEVCASGEVTFIADTETLKVSYMRMIDIEFSKLSFYFVLHEERKQDDTRWIINWTI
jgi:hypothetical protein